MARTVRSRLSIGAGLLVAVAFALTGLAPARQAYTQQLRIEAEERKLAALENENARLGHRLQRLNDPEYVEKLAREQLGLVRPGEISYVVVPPPQVTETSVAPTSESRSGWKKILDWAASLLD